MERGKSVTVAKIRVDEEEHIFFFQEERQTQKKIVLTGAQ
jgi:hypothetical protein